MLGINLVILLHSSVDSDLEVFRHNPADGSFAPLAVQNLHGSCGFDLYSYCMKLF